MVSVALVGFSNFLMDCVVNFRKLFKNNRIILIKTMKLDVEKIFF